jgi:hypothetical protein
MVRFGGGLISLQQTFKLYNLQAKRKSETSKFRHGRLVIYRSGHARQLAQSAHRFGDNFNGRFHFLSRIKPAETKPQAAPNVVVC